ncbi:hypothetical protein IL38_04290 [Actinopolyspora erythraea]|uniref:Uncharacterized protein n=1 Tax=Actinopolyspora erythraea TaxID=414996 RepID=A0ABR4X7F0_9ACTN|nr:hypothetical protein IL38_04290 [Actinopolyspora erythraea]
MRPSILATVGRRGLDGELARGRRAVSESPDAVPAELSPDVSREQLGKGRGTGVAGVLRQLSKCHCFLAPSASGSIRPLS